MLSIVTWIVSLVCVSTGETLPCRSPLTGMALPVLDTRAPTVTWSNFDSTICGVMAMESSRVTVAGRSLTCVRTIASGMRGPWAARAKINTVSSGAAVAATLGSRVTCTVSEAPWPVSAAATAVEGTGSGCMPSFDCNSLICSVITATSLLSGGNCAAARCQ